ncbi:MAG: hypothetical protein JXC85_06255 [Candidatus Aenigmarchaeota archaeon]|nr:hypothetical protein [Candidatus Aenigmarchaeota archaeon]
MIDYWIREGDEKLLGYALNADARPCHPGYLTGDIQNDCTGWLSNVNDYFILARWKLWKPGRDSEQEYDFAHVKKAALYPQGVVFTPFTANEIQLDYKSRLVHRKERIELVGSDSDGFVQRFFPTQEQLFSKQETRDHHPFLYRSADEFIVEVPGSFPISALDSLLRAEGVLMDECVRGSKYKGIISMCSRTVVFTGWPHHTEESMKNMPEFIAAFADKNSIF